MDAIIGSTVKLAFGLIHNTSTPNFETVLVMYNLYQIRNKTIDNLNFKNFSHFDKSY